MQRSEADATDAALVAHSLTGDRGAFARLVERHRAGVARLLRAMFANLADVEDLVQESFLRAYLDLDRLRDPGRFGVWVRSIAVNLARMELRAGRVTLVSLEALEAGVTGPRRAPESQAERRELARRIRAAVAALPPAERAAIEQVYLHELSHRAAAEELDTTAGSIKVRVHRGRRRLQQSLAGELPGRARRMEDKMIEVTVADVLAKIAEDETLPAVDDSRPATEQAEAWLVRFSRGSHRAVLLAEKEGERVLPIWIGPVEGEAIAIQLQGRSPARPLTFDLLKDVLAAGDLQLRHAAISRLDECVYYASLVVQRNGAPVQEIDCRPSDAINLALRMEAPIFVAAEVMGQEGVVVAERGGYGFLEREVGERWVSVVDE